MSCLALRKNLEYSLADLSLKNPAKAVAKESTFELNTSSLAIPPANISIRNSYSGTDVANKLPSLE